jgi:hypothetical protein
LLIQPFAIQFCVLAYTHVDSDGNVIRGKLVHFPCEAEIVIFSPLDSNDHRLFVIVKGFHTHYLPSQTKPSMVGKLAYRDAAEAFAKNSVASITVGRLERGKLPPYCNWLVILSSSTLDPSTRQSFNGDPANIDPGLADIRLRRRIVAEVKKEHAPEGNSFQGEYLLIQMS